VQTGSVTSAGLSEEVLPAEAGAFEETLAGQVLGIILEVLDSPGLLEESKERLRRRLDEHPGHPERALAEHLREIRSAKLN
jgi:hypothetical protein